MLPTPWGAVVRGVKNNCLSTFKEKAKSSFLH